MNILKKWWPSILAILAPIGAAALPGVRDMLVKQHPEWSAVIAAVAVVIAHHLPSPLNSATPGSPNRTGPPSSEIGAGQTK